MNEIDESLYSKDAASYNRKLKVLRDKYGCWNCCRFGSHCNPLNGCRKRKTNESV